MLYYPIPDVIVMESAIVGDGEVLYVRTYQLEVAPVPVPMTMEAGTEDPSGLCKVDGFPAMLAADQERAQACQPRPSAPKCAGYQSLQWASLRPKGQGANCEIGKLVRSADWMV
jgi:hypothetical protein